MSKIEVNAIEPQSGTTLTLGASGDTITIPSGATINNQGSAVNFGPTGAVSWNTTKVTTGFTATAGIGYFCDTTSAAFTVTLPSSPAAGAVIGITDYANTFATNNITVGRNGSNIGGSAINGTLSTNGISVTFVYVDATQGWIVTDSGNRSDLPTALYVAATGGTVTTCGNYKIHTFTGPGTFTVSCAGNPSGSTTVDYLVVAGGGGGGGSQGGDSSGGGAAGGFREGRQCAPAYTASPLVAPTGLPVSVTAYPITVGSGGSGAPPACVSGTNGNNSVFSTITSAGGGYGGTFTGPRLAPASLGNPGGSGGGGAGGTPSARTGGTGNTPPVAPSQGQNGGVGGASSPDNSGAGGGGAGGTGQPNAVRNTCNATNVAYGGVGVATSISGSSTGYSGGGGGSSYPAIASSNTNPGSPFGGGLGGFSNNQTAGTANTGGGGGAGGGSPPGSYSGAAGGSGIVIVRYKFQ